MKLFIIGGKAKSGKNTLANFLREELKEYGYKACIINLTEPLYSYAKNHFEWNEYSDKKPREFLQKVGIEIIKEKLGKKTFLLDRAIEDIEILSCFFDAFIIADARLQMEFTYLKEKFPTAITIKLIRPNYDPNLTEEEQKHITETDLENYNDFNYIIENKNINELRLVAKKIVEEEEGEVL